MSADMQSELERAIRSMFSPDEIVELLRRFRDTGITRDEVYVVAQGRGEFVSDQGRQSFGPQDLLFAPAGIAHRFENFTDDLIVWVMFYGPEGGEAAAVK